MMFNLSFVENQVKFLNDPALMRDEEKAMAKDLSKLPYETSVMRCFGISGTGAVFTFKFGWMMEKLELDCPLKVSYREVLRHVVRDQAAILSREYPEASVFFAEAIESFEDDVEGLVGYKIIIFGSGNWVETTFFEDMNTLNNDIYRDVMDGVFVEWPLSSVDGLKTAKYAIVGTSSSTVGFGLTLAETKTEAIIFLRKAVAANKEMFRLEGTPCTVYISPDNTFAELKANGVKNCWQITSGINFAKVVA